MRQYTVEGVDVESKLPTTLRLKAESVQGAAALAVERDVKIASVLDENGRTWKQTQAGEWKEASVAEPASAGRSEIRALVMALLCLVFPVFGFLVAAIRVGTDRRDGFGCFAFSFVGMILWGGALVLRTHPVL